MGWSDVGYLRCGHCGTEFLGTTRQIKRVKYEDLPSYCSPACRQTAVSTKLRTPKPIYGPCPTCGEKFESRVPKVFCSQRCYSQSPQFKAMVKANFLKAVATTARSLEGYRVLHTHPCMECDTPFYSPPAKRKRFCNTRCYRSYFAKRFDRWVASPQRIALPQNFDEFLTQEELPCLVDGCDWIGHGLSGHMNQAHGVPAEDFKRAAGFNLGSGIISAPLQKTLSARANVGVALHSVPRPFNPAKRGYVSLEWREHATKSRMLADGTGPGRVCQQCRVAFTQSSPFGRAKYCGKKCQSSAMKERASMRAYEVRCSCCERPFLGTKAQQLRSERRLDIACSTHCRQTLNSRKRYAPICNTSAPDLATPLQHPDEEAN